MKMKVTPVIKKHGPWYVAYVREIPGVNTQGRTLGEVRRNVHEALDLILQANRELANCRRRKMPLHRKRSALSS